MPGGVCGGESDGRGSSEAASSTMPLGSTAVDMHNKDISVLARESASEEPALQVLRKQHGIPPHGD